jgi:hypothetical protein
MDWILSTFTFSASIWLCRDWSGFPEPLPAGPLFGPADNEGVAMQRAMKQSTARIRREFAMVPPVWLESGTPSTPNRSKILQITSRAGRPEGCVKKNLWFSPHIMEFPSSLQPIIANVNQYEPETGIEMPGDFNFVESPPRLDATKNR